MVSIVFPPIKGTHFRRSPAACGIALVRRSKEIFYESSKLSCELIFPRFSSHQKLVCRWPAVCPLGVCFGPQASRATAPPGYTQLTHCRRVPWRLIRTGPFPTLRLFSSGSSNPPTPNSRGRGGVLRLGLVKGPSAGQGIESCPKPTPLRVTAIDFDNGTIIWVQRYTTMREFHHRRASTVPSIFVEVVGIQREEGASDVWGGGWL